MTLKKVSDGVRRARQAGRLARVLKVLELIQGRDRYGVKDLAAELECSERTVWRDLAVLELAGVPYHHDRETRSLQVRPGYRFPTLNLADDDLLGLGTANALASATGLNVTNGAGPTARKLRATSKAESAGLLAEVERVTSVLDLKLADHGRHHEIIRTVQWALIQRKRLTGDYASPYESTSKRVDLHPYRLCLVKQAWYLIARPAGSEHPRTYRIARFKTLRPLGSPAEAPDDFDLQAYFGDAWGVYRGDKTYDVEVRFSREAAELVAETTWHSTQTIERHKDGGVTLRFRVDGLNEIVHWILGWSGRATVVQPPELRRQLLEHLRTAMALKGDEHARR
jgi:predicted DNA-binding transcriptional regulator YafY